MSTHGRRLQVLDKAGQETGTSIWLRAVAEITREKEAAVAIARFAVNLAGMPLPPLPPSPPLAPDAVVATPVPRVPQGRKWTKDIRPGRHDILTWEEAMQVPWIDGTASGSSAASKTIETLPQHLKDQFDAQGVDDPILCQKRTLMTYSA